MNIIDWADAKEYSNINIVSSNKYSIAANQSDDESPSDEEE